MFAETYEAARAARAGDRKGAGAVLDGDTAEEVADKAGGIALGVAVDVAGNGEVAEDSVAPDVGERGDEVHVATLTNGQRVAVALEGTLE